MDERFREALARNALLADVLAEGTDADAEAALRARLALALARTRRRRVLSRLVAAAAAVVLAVLARPGRPPETAPSPPTPAVRPPLLVVVPTSAVRPRFDVVSTPAGSSLEIVRTASLRAPLDLARDEDLLSAPGVVAIVGHPGAPRRLFVGP